MRHGSVRYDHDEYADRYLERHCYRFQAAVRATVQVHYMARQRSSMHKKDLLESMGPESAACRWSLPV